MKILVLDVETTIKNKGDPFDQDNRLCYVGLRDSGGNTYLYDIEYSGTPYGVALQEIQTKIEEADLLIGFNIKFDLHWLRKYVPNIRYGPVWDCQLGSFILSNQADKFPSLDEVCSKHNLGSKLDIVSTEYWANGIDTPDVPESILREYLSQDLDLTHKLYGYQRGLLQYNKVFKLQCQDLLVLQEMEFNGLYFDKEKSLNEESKCNEEITLLDHGLTDLTGLTNINWGSSDHISTVLFGGYITCPCSVPTHRILKDGTVRQGTKKGFSCLSITRRINPLPDSETLPTRRMSDYMLAMVNKKRQEEGKNPFTRIYSVDKESLRIYRSKYGKDKQAKAIIDLLLRRSEVGKLQSTYYGGIPKIMEEHNWPEGYIHGQFNQCRVVTGRLSSSRPNLQNIANNKEVKQLFRSRYG